MRMSEPKPPNDCRIEPAGYCRCQVPTTLSSDPNSQKPATVLVDQKQYLRWCLNALECDLDLAKSPDVHRLWRGLSQRIAGAELASRSAHRRRRKPQHCRREDSA